MARLLISLRYPYTRTEKFVMVSLYFDKGRRYRKQNINVWFQPQKLNAKRKGCSPLSNSAHGPLQTWFPLDIFVVNHPLGNQLVGQILLVLFDCNRLLVLFLENRYSFTLRGLYCVTIYVGVFSSPLLVCFSFFVRSLLYMPISLVFTPHYLATNFPVW